MKTFYFTVRGDRITEKEDYIFIEGNKGSYEAVFDFGAEWEDMAKLCIVENGEDVYKFAIIGNSCLLPEMAKSSAKIGVIGVDSLDGAELVTRISTNMIGIGVQSGAASKETTASLNSAAAVWEKYLSDMERSRKAAEAAKDAADNARVAAEAAQQGALSSETKTKAHAKEAEKHIGKIVVESENRLENLERDIKTNLSEAQASANQALAAAGNADSFAKQAKDHANDAETSRMAALMAQDLAEIAISHNPVIIDGYWYVWSVQTEEYINTEVKAQSGSEVYVGANPPDTADVIIDLEGESAIYAPYIGANGNWYTFNPETQTFTDSGNCAVGKDGYTPIKGADYFTEDDIKELEKCVIEAASDDLNQANESAIDAKTSADNAATSEKTASQALADLLAMINSGDLVLATDGKLPLSSIPATATQEIYAVSSETELTSLTAQRGDLAELIEEVDGERTITKTWQCLGDASVRENWVVWGTSYAVQSGNATTADNALNANMINNHRLVEMSAEEFESAVKDTDTYYLVY